MDAQRTYGLLVLSLLLLLPDSVSASNRFLDSIENQLVTAAVSLVNVGYEITHEPHTGQLAHGRKEYVTLRLTRGVSYGLVAVCDQDCSDLDLVLYDENGNLITSDIELDDNPVVEVTPRRTATFKLLVKMADCNHSPCYYGVGVFGQ